MVKFTTTGMYAGFSREASVHRTMSTISLVAKIREVTHTSAANKVNGSKSAVSRFDIMTMKRDAIHRIHSFFVKFLSLFTFVCLISRQYNYTFHELRMQLENQVVQIQIQY